MSIDLDQRGRSGLQFLGSLQKFAGGTLQQRARQEFDAEVPDPPPDLQGRREAARSALEHSRAWRFDRFFTRYVAEEIYVRAVPAIERVRDQAERLLKVPDEHPGTLQLDPDIEAPAYWVEGFHLTPGGWDGHELMGAIIHDIAYDYVLVPGGVGAVKTGDDLNDQRSMFAREAQRDDYRRILEVGSGTGRLLRSLSAVYPGAEVHGVELSSTELQRAHAMAATQGHPWHLKQADAVATGYPDGNFDLVAVYTLFHEVPPHATEAILGELFRVLEPGGDLLIGDVAPYGQQEPFQTVVMDWETDNRGEPYWRSALQLDLPAMLKSIGFVGVEAYGMNGATYPWVTRACKPSPAP